jgi:nucleotide-binding universal stress UspA family protein
VIADDRGDMSFLVAIDLSVPSRSAIELATRLSRETGLSPVLLHVSEGRPPLQLLADLYTLAEPLRALGSTPRLRTAQGDPVACICGYAREHRVEFVLMGTRGDSDDSIARRVMESCTVPVMAVQPRAEAHAWLSIHPGGPRSLRLDRLMETLPGEIVSSSSPHRPTAVSIHTAGG